jgi:Fis family transcriptional regulator
MVTISNNPGMTSLSESVVHSVRKYFLELKGDEPVELHQLVLEEVEAVLFRTAMEYCKYNQSNAAILLGISRGMLRAKLRHYFDEKYVGTR